MDKSWPRVAFLLLIMASTQTVQNSMTFAQYFIGNRSMSLSSLQPALTAANIVCQVMLQPPFKWRWNRSTTSFALSTAGSPIVQAVSDFGFIEKAYITDPLNVVTEIPKITTEVSADKGTGRPHTIAAYLDDNAGNITFGFLPGLPDKNYTVNVIYQQKPALLTALTGAPGTWPIPDEYGHVYNTGFLAWMYLFADSAKFNTMNQMFKSSLLALSEGLTEQQIAVFLGQYDYLVQNAMTVSGKVQQGYTGRGI